MMWPVIWFYYGEMRPFHGPILGLQELRFSVYLFDLLSMLLRCNGFPGTQKAVVDQSSCRQPVTMTLFRVQGGLGKCFGASSQSSHRAGHWWLLYKIQFSSHIIIQSRNYSLLCRIRKDDTSKQHFFFFVISSWGFPGSLAGKEPTCNVGDQGSTPGLGRSPGEGNDYSLQYSDLENSMACMVCGVAKSWTWLSDFHFHEAPTYQAFSPFPFVSEWS